MSILQSLRQQHFLERQVAPTTSKMISGMSGAIEGVPKYHPLKTAMSAVKASTLIHGLRNKKFQLKKPLKLAKLAKL